MADRKYGSETLDSDGNIVALHGCELRVVHLLDQEAEGSDYWQAWVNGVQDDGLSRNEAIRNAYARSHDQKECLIRLRKHLESKIGRDLAKDEFEKLKQEHQKITPLLKESAEFNKNIIVGKNNIPR